METLWPYWKVRLPLPRVPLRPAGEANYRETTPARTLETPEVKL